MLSSYIIILILNIIKILNSKSIKIINGTFFLSIFLSIAFIDKNFRIILMLSNFFYNKVK